MKFIVYFLSRIFDIERPITEAILMQLEFLNSITNQVEIGDFWVVNLDNFEELEALRKKFGDFCIKPGEEYNMHEYFLLFMD